MGSDISFDTRYEMRLPVMTPPPCICLLASLCSRAGDDVLASDVFVDLSLVASRKVGSCGGLHYRHGQPSTTVGPKVLGAMEQVETCQTGSS
jgi:hypothetical protein